MPSTPDSSRFKVEPSKPELHMVVTIPPSESDNGYCKEAVVIIFQNLDAYLDAIRPYMDDAFTVDTNFQEPNPDNPDNKGDTSATSQSFNRVS
jgi:hypothetical protein